MTNEVANSSPRTVEQIDAEIAQTRERIDSVLARIVALTSGAEKSEDPNETFQLFADVVTLGGKPEIKSGTLQALESERQKIVRDQAAQRINAVLNPMHDLVRDLFTADIIAELKAAEAGNTVTIQVQLPADATNADGTPSTVTVNHRTSNSAATQPASGQKSETTPSSAGGGGARYTWDGKSAADYLLAYGDDATKSHVQKVQNKEVSYNDLSKRADALLNKLGHEKVRVN